jgi:uncharacterized membrane protein
MYRVSRTDGIDAVVVLLTVLAGIALWPQLPSRMAIHFSAAGAPDTYVPKLAGVLLMPVVMVLTVGVIKGATRLDPPEDPRTMHVVRTATALFLAAIHLLVLGWNVGYAVPFDAVLVGSLLWAVGISGYAVLREQRVL